VHAPTKTKLDFGKAYFILENKTKTILYSYRTFAPCDLSTIISLYKSQGLSLLDYVSVVWTLIHRKTNLLESVQSFATRMAIKSWRESSVIFSQGFENPTLPRNTDVSTSNSYLPILFVLLVILCNNLTLIVDCITQSCYFNLLCVC